MSKSIKVYFSVTINNKYTTSEYVVDVKDGDHINFMLPITTDFIPVNDPGPIRRTHSIAPSWVNQGLSAGDADDE